MLTARVTHGRFKVQSKKKADVAEPLKDSTASAYSLSRPPASAGLRCIESSEITTSQNKKADVAKPSEGFHHVGLLFIAPTGISRVALYIVIRKFLSRSIESHKTAS